MFKNLFKPKSVDFIAPFSGKLMTIEEVPDEVFSSKSVGDGFAIDMTDGNVYSPVDGRIVALFPTGHALGIKSHDRNEYLLHLGLDSVLLNGKGFEVFVEEEQTVKKGDILLKVDLDFMKENRIKMICPILVTNANNRKIKLLKEGQIEAKEPGFLAIVP